MFRRKLYTLICNPNQSNVSDTDTPLRMPHPDRRIPYVFLWLNETTDRHDRNGNVMTQCITSIDSGRDRWLSSPCAPVLVSC